MSSNFASQHLNSLPMAARYRAIVAKAATDGGEKGTMKSEEAVIEELRARISKRELTKVVFIGVVLAALGALAMTGIAYWIG